MQKHRYPELDFSKVLNIICQYAASDLTRELIRNIDVVFHPQRVNQNLNQTTEALELLENYPDLTLPSFACITDLNPLWAHISAGELLDAMEARKMLRYFNVCEETSKLLEKLDISLYPELVNITSAWQPTAELHARTKKIFNIDGEVKDNASPELEKARIRLRGFENEILRKLDPVRQAITEETNEQFIHTIRSNRFVIVLPRKLVTSFSGNILDVSSSGNSVFFEPREIVDANTERQHLFIAESQEVVKVLAEYGKLIARHAGILRSNLQIMVRLDFVFARANYASSIGANRPRYSNTNTLQLEDAAHPLLLENFVPETLRFNPETSCVIISGVNAGGKTLLLKLIGIYYLLSAIGCYLPGKCQLRSISGIFADIGDEQSATDNLSTFTAHLNFITRVYDELESMESDADPLLLLFDEIGTGTEPSEGAAFAYAVIFNLLQYPVLAAVTTHYDLMKTMAYKQAKVKNVSFEYDHENLKPTFQISDNQPGQSYALSIAHQWQIKDEIIKLAEEMMGDQKIQLNEIIKEISATREEARRYRRQAQEQAAEVTQIRNQNRELAEELQQERKKFETYADKIKQQLSITYDELLAETKKKLKRRYKRSAQRQDEFVKAASKSARVTEHQKHVAHEKIDEILSAITTGVDSKTADNLEIKAGDRVRMNSLSVSGVVVEIEQNKKIAVVDVNNKKMKVRIDNLEPLPSASNAIKQHSSAAASHQSRSGEVSLNTNGLDSSDTVDLHGLTVLEASERLDEFLDRAILGNISTIRIMHGIGTGRLKEFVSDYLRKSPYTKNVRTAGSVEGGAGVTLADLT